MTVVVTGANGLVGAEICRALAGSGARVRAVVRRPGAAPQAEGIVEQVGDFANPTVAADLVTGADAVITTVHPLGADRATQARVAVDGTAVLAHAAAEGGVSRLIHISTAAVYDRSPGVGDVDEGAALVSDDANDYAVTKRDTDRALASIDGITRVLLRPPAILGPGPSSVWNTRRPAAMRESADARHAVATQTFAWVHVSDLARFAAGLATGQITDPPAGGCVAVNVASGPATVRDYYDTVTRALGLEAIYDDAPAWTGRILTDRARAWGWQPRIDLSAALAEVAAGLSPGSTG